MSQNLHTTIWRWNYVSGIYFLYMGALVRSHFSFGSHAEIPPFSCGSPFLVLPCPWARASYSSWNLCWPFPSRLPCLYQVVIPFSWVFLAFLSFMSAPWLWVISHIAQACLMSSQVEPFYISFAAWSPLYWEENFPRVLLSCTCFLALSIGMFHCLELVCLPATLFFS